MVGAGGSAHAFVRRVTANYPGVDCSARCPLLPRGLASREGAETHRGSQVAANRLRDITRAFASDQIASIGSQALPNLRDVLGIDWDIPRVRRNAVSRSIGIYAGTC